MGEAALFRFILETRECDYWFRSYSKYKENPGNNEKER
jgi:hypothetical protein